MNICPPIKLSRLRDIGWKEWDPIGLLATDHLWDHKTFADEYDSYLLYAVGRLRRGGTLEEVIIYLLNIERGHMGLGIKPDQEDRAKATARAIGAYMDELDNLVKSAD